MVRDGFPIRLFLGIGVFWALVMLAELALNLPSTPFERGEMISVVGSFSRAHNVLVSIVMVSVALAVPITATTYTPKLLRLFLTDRIHLTMLGGYAFAAVHASWVMYLVREGRGSMIMLSLVLATLTLGFIAIVPYFFYIIIFLDPSTLVDRIGGLARDATKTALRNGPRFHAAKLGLSNSLHNLGTLVLKAVDGLRRQSVSDGVQALRAVLADYGSAKDRLDPGWFEATKDEFRGLSREALQFISADRCWVEIVALQDLNLVFEAAVKRMPDAVVSIADTLRGIGIDAHKRGDIPVVDNVVRAFNSMIRSAINHSEPHAIFDVLNQYRALAEECAPARPELATEVATYMSRYGLRARAAKLELIPELFLYDVGALLRAAVETRCPAVPGIIEVFVELLRRLADAPTVPLSCAFLVTLGSVHRELGEEDLARLSAGAEHLSRAALEDGLGVLDRTISPRYQELTARQVDLNFLPPQDVEHLRAFVSARFGVHEG